jgi:guanosine-3',5'-bis(diphosphate) 3'-pyrophosphohydrolase
MSDALDYRLLLEATAFAARAHRGQLRKDGQTPYASHPFRVCLVVREVFGFDDLRMLAAALLHDTIEDTTTDFDDLEEAFGPEIAVWVACLSKDKRLPDPAREREYLERLRAAPWQVQVCKLADVFDNVTDSSGLPEGRRAHSHRRAAQYLEALAKSPASEVQRPLQMVRDLLRQVQDRREGGREGGPIAR